MRRSSLQPMSELNVLNAYQWALLFVIGLYGLAAATRAENITPPATDLTSVGDSQVQSDHQVRVAGIVLKWLRADKEANYARAEKLITIAAQGGAKLVCTTECFLDGYAIKDKSIPLDQYRALGEPIPGGTYFKRLASLADQLNIYLIAGMLEADGEKRYNTAVLIDPDGRLLGRYRKHKLEHELVRNTPGTETPVFDTPFGRLGIMICADRRDPELVAKLRSNGASLLICPSGGMFGSEKNDPIIQTRSKENGVPILFVHPAEFLVTDSMGKICARTILGDRLEIMNADVGGVLDRNEVFYCELPLVRTAGKE